MSSFKETSRGIVDPSYVVVFRIALNRLKIMQNRLLGCTGFVNVTSYYTVDTRYLKFQTMIFTLR